MVNRTWGLGSWSMRSGGIHEDSLCTYWLGGLSGVLRVQVVPGEIPFLLPAYFLTELQAVIDMRNLVICYMAHSVHQRMMRMSTGHVAVCITEFGSGFNVPADFAGTRSQVWSVKANDVLHRPSVPYASSSSMAGPLAALAAALVGIHGAAGSAVCFMEVIRTPQLRGVRRLQRQREELEQRSLALAQEEQRMLAEVADANTVKPGTTLTMSRRDDRVRPLACIMGKGKYLVPCLEDSTHCRHLNTKHGANKNMSFQKCTNCQQEQQMPLTPISQLEQHPCVFQARVLPEEADQGGEEGQERDPVGRWFGLDASPTGPRLQVQDINSKGQQESQHPGVLFGPGGVRRRGTRGDGLATGVGACDSHWPSGHCHGQPPGRSTSPAARPVQSRRPAAPSTQGEWPTPLALLESTVQESMGASSRSSATSYRSDHLPGMQRPGDDDRTGCSSGCTAHRTDLHELSVQPGNLPLPASGSLHEDGTVQHREPEQVSSWWLSSPPPHADPDETYGGLLDTLQLDPQTTFVAIGYGDVVKGKSPIVTSTFVSRRVILTHGGDDLWRAVDVTNTPGDDYAFGAPVDYVVFYEFNPEFIDYLNETEYENEVTLSNSDKAEINRSLDGMLGDLTTYWALWEEAEEHDDVAEIYGSLWDADDSTVEIYSPPRVVQRAQARGLKAELSVDLSTGVGLSQRPQKAQIRQELQHRKPRLLITCPPCTKFSPLQNLRWYPEMLQEELGPAIEHLDYSMTLQGDQLQRGDLGLHEHPRTATSWQLPSVKKFLAHDAVVLVKVSKLTFVVLASESGRS